MSLVACSQLCIERASERERKRASERESERERKRVRGRQRESERAGLMEFAISKRKTGSSCRMRTQRLLVWPTKAPACQDMRRQLTNRCRCSKTNYLSVRHSYPHPTRPHSAAQHSNAFLRLCMPAMCMWLPG